MIHAPFLRPNAGAGVEPAPERKPDAAGERPQAAQGHPLQRRWVRTINGIYELSPGGGRLRSMEGLRGLAVLLVYFVHTNALFGTYIRRVPLLRGTSEFLGTIGNSGVDLFFVLSGFLIYAALLRHRVGIGSFLRRRVQRIYPTFLAVFALYLLLSWLFPANSKLSGRGLGNALLYLLENFFLLPGIFRIQPMITVAWSLSYEFFFYLAAALLIAGTRPWMWKARSRIVLILSIWAGQLLYSFSVPSSHVRLSMFLVGMLLYEALGSKAFRGCLRPWGVPSAIVLTAAAAVFVYFLASGSRLLGFLPGRDSGRDLLPGIFVYQGPYTVLALGLSMFVDAAYVLGAAGRLQKVFVWTPLRYLGNMSYSFYLIHGVTLQGIGLVADAAVRRGAPSTSVFITAVLLGFVAAWLTSTVLFVFIEKPFSLQRPTCRVRPESEVILT
jgi:exopolysaccharide production protein ExoZ